MLISDLGKIVTGKTPLTKRKEYWDGDIPFVTPGDLQNSKHINSTSRYISEQGMLSVKGTILPKDSVCVSCIGNIGYVGKTTKTSVSNQQINSIIVNDKHNADYVYYLMKSLWRYFKNCENQSTTLSILNKTQFTKIQVVDHSREEEDRIAEFLNMLDLKIEMNTNVNDNLVQQALALYREMFINTSNTQRKTCKAQEFFDIAIGKTPPRKEHQWFSTNPSDVTWVSISDMGSCGTYISKSSEQLTAEAIKKFNIKIIPDNTVILSFKLTVGRVAITHGEMATNEAIAHFKTDNPVFNEYLYCYLKEFNYQTMGSTSSIATAVNSKIIKAMPFVVPTNDEIAHFHGLVGPMFSQILVNQIENDHLTELRNSLLPKLMSGEIDVSDIEL